ncbi:Ribonuclease H-like protein [Akanthomyces lecanii RCEF 1005]|uniref:Ribonuclease H-like protein n=1 Tax=Akanthomyces lecanii RCEF 1005 TaxID=1081108 RepID=A0A167UHU9_CORDF|nr:Ribonuclease H-like protein [Akanthomyces lecanii RCEF 1005]
MTKPQRLVQCQNCWRLHSPGRCTATKTCRTCGVSHAEHDTEHCQTTPKCANCHGPHHADFGQCYARPKKVGDTYHKLSKSQKTHAKKLGSDDYRRHNIKVMIRPLDKPQALNSEATATSNVDAVDTEMAGTTEEDVHTTPQDDHLPALAEDEDMGDADQEQPQTNEGAMEENAEPGRAEEVPDSQEQLEERENEIENTAEHQATEVEGEDKSENSNDEDDEDDYGDNDEAAATQQNHQHKQPATNPRNAVRTTLTRAMQVPARKVPRVQIASRPTLLKNKYINADMTQQIIPSETTNPTSDAPAEQEILMRNAGRNEPQPVANKIFQANVDKEQEAHSAALQPAFLEGYNVVILQEPNTSYNKKKELCRTQYHPGFLCFSPVDFWHNKDTHPRDTRPRVMTYVKIDRKIQAERRTPAKHRDLLWVRVNGIAILNLYNRPEVESTLSVCHGGSPPHDRVASLHHWYRNAKPGPAQTTPVKVRVTTPDEIKAFGDHVGKAAVKSLPANIDSQAQIEDMARQLQEVLQNSARACGRRRTRRPPDHKTHLRKTKRRGSASFQTQVLPRPTAHKAEILAWMKPRQRLQPPPIQVGDMTYSTDVEKATALRREKLERRDASDDVADGWQPAVSSPKEIPFAKTISIEEIEKAVWHTGNTTPGSDGITTRMLQRLQTAEVVMTPKVNKRDLTIYFLSGAAQRYGYADDTAMLFIGDSLEDTARQANEAITAMESWGRGEAIHFTPEKTEVMHFSRRKADHDQSPIIHHGDKEIRATPSMRWLGIWLDKKPTFNHHIDEWTQKARRVINHLRAMNNTLERPRERLTKENAVPEFEQWLAGRPAGYVVFSDGSKTDTDKAGYGFAVFHHGQLLDWDSGQLGRREIFDAELHGALEGSKAAMQQNSRLEPITVCMDNTSVIACIGATAAVSSQACFREFQKIGDKHPYLISVKWSPGHTGIFGNKLADQIARHGATLPTDEHLPSVSYRKRQMRKQIAVDHRAWWASVERTEYRKLGLSAELKKLPELSLPRRLLGYLLTARSQHGDFAE